MGDYTIAELMAVCLAREIRDGERVLQGLYSPLPMIACLLAKNFHAPNMVYINTADTIDPQPREVPFSTADPALQERAVAYIPLWQTFDLAQQGKLDLIFLGAAQVDRYGNTNLSVIGPYEKPKVRLPAGAASAHLCAIMDAVIWVPRHNARVLVEKVDFITGQGYLTGGNARKRAGIAKGGPRKVVTNLCILDFEPETKAMKLVSTHPGVTLEEIKENTGFDLIIPEDIDETAPPRAEELEFIGTIDPQEVRELEFH
jgi:glutaconate CoA-transferase subunit B